MTTYVRLNRLSEGAQNEHLIVRENDVAVTGIPFVHNNAKERQCNSQRCRNRLNEQQTLVRVVQLQSIAFVERHWNCYRHKIQIRSCCSLITYPNPAAASEN